MKSGVWKTISKHNPLPLLSRIFNIAPSQWPRVTECWFITLFFKMGGAIGLTIITSAFIGRFGIVYLPVLLIVSALLIILSTFFFEHLIMKVKREVLMISMLFVASLSLFAASFFYESSPIAFFTFLIIAESFFLAQFNIFIPILVGDRFTPLESQNTFPLVESGETIGGIIGGTLVGLFATRFPIQWFIYIWIGALICGMGVFIITSFARTSLPSLPIRANNISLKPERHEMRKVFEGVRNMPFFKGLVVAVFMQWIFMNVLDFQFTKSVEQSITNTPEATIVYEHEESAQGALQASVLSGGDNGLVEAQHADPRRIERTLSVSQEAALSEKLGTLRSGFHVAALIVQALVATRLISLLGVVGSMLLHPIIMLISLLGMFFRFGVLTSTLTRMNFEVTNVVYKNAYFASHYALPKTIRDQAAEFLEGVVRPLGTILAMGFIIALQMIFSGSALSMWIHAFMFVVMFGILFSTIRLQNKYTDISKDQLFSDELPYPEKLNAIEILAQRGHRDAPQILAQKLAACSNDEESVPVRIKLLSALGEFADYRTLPDILDALNDPDSDVRLEAAHALLNFKQIGEQFYSQSFSRFRMVEALKETFKTETSSSVRSAIIRVFSILRQAEIVPFLLDQLKAESHTTRADCIYTLGLFKDPNTAYYILPTLEDEHPTVHANAIIALWQFPKYRTMVLDKLDEMLAHKDVAVLKAAIFALGEIAVVKDEKLYELLHCGAEDVELEAAFALSKCGDASGFMKLVDHYSASAAEEFEVLRRFVHRLSPDPREMAQRVLVHLISQELNALIHLKNITSIEQIDVKTLEKLRRLYKLIGQHEELYELENVLRERTTAAGDELTLTTALILPTS